MIEDFSSLTLPDHVAIIMDGNRRWAKKRGLPAAAGHRAGAKTFEKIANTCLDIGIKYLTVYAFSTENWKRSKEEIDTIQSLFRQYIKRVRDIYFDRDVRLLFPGDNAPFEPALRRDIEDVERDTADKKTMTISICANYGSRSEIANAVKKVAEQVKRGEIAVEDIDEEMIERQLYTRLLPSPDLIIRPGGEKRLSNFLLWQSAYSELIFIDRLWPDFSDNDLLCAFKEFSARARRYGG